MRAQLFFSIKPFLSRWRIYLATFLTLLIAEIFLLNTVPLVTGEIGTLFVPRHIPEDYLVLKDFILQQPEYFRTLWVPTDSRWGIYTNRHPKVSLVSVIGDKWKPFLDETAFGNTPSENRNKIMDVLKHTFSNSLLDSSSIKYVIVPLQDRANDDDFFVHYGMSQSFYLNELDALPYLKRIDIGTAEVVVYENEGYRDHVYASNEIWSLENFNRLDEKRNFLASIIGSPFQFTVPTERSAQDKVPLSRLTSLFEQVTPESIETNTLNQSLTPNDGESTLFEETSRLNLLAITTPQTLTIISQPEQSLTLNHVPVSGVQNTNLIASISLQNDRQYFLKIGSALTPIQKNGEPQRVGSIPQTMASLDVVSTNNVNLVPNGSFEERLWQEKVGDCNAYDDKGILDMRLSVNSASDGHSSLQLEAVSHIACVSTTFNIGEETYLFSFDYQSPNASQAGYFLQFQNEKEPIFYSERIPAKNSWQTFSRSVTAPAGTKSMSVFFYAYAHDDSKRIINRYDNVRLVALKHEQRVSLQRSKLYQPFTNGETNSSNLKFRYSEPSQTLSNLIQNGSFDNGLWSETVGDCNAYDDRPMLGMALRQAQDDKYLELSATHHIACTGPGQIPVKESRDYLLSFTYQSSNAIEAGYYIGFNDPKGSKISQRLPIKNIDWQTFSKTITIPPGATSASLAVYSYAKDEQTNILNNYDDFVFFELPDIRDRYYFVERPATRSKISPTLSWDFVNPTKLIARVLSVKGSFFLMMSESFHPSWQAFIRQKGAPDLAWWEVLMFQKPGIKIPDSQHIEANGFANGWWISENDVAQLQRLNIRSNVQTSTKQWFAMLTGTEKYGPDPCEKCTDSQGYEIVLEFWPQRFFYIGLLMSGLTLIGCLGYLLYDWRKKEKPAI